MMHPLRAVRKLLTVAAVVSLLASCGDVVRQGHSPVFLTVDKLEAAPGNKPQAFTGTLSSDVASISPDPCSTSTPCVFNDLGLVTLFLSPKDFTVAPTSNNQVTINRYRVTYRRSDGRSTPGVDVPYGFVGAVTGTVPPTGSLDLSFELVRLTAKGTPPLLGLVRNSGVVISTIADVTFFGTDQVGNEISVEGSILVNFGDFADQ
jgi:hypothetical protein